MSRPTELHERFVHYLAGLAEREDRSALAHLRRGLSRDPGTDLGMSPYVARFVRSSAGPREEESYYLVAALFAWHPAMWAGETDGWERSLGASFARLVQAERERTKSEPASIELRFTALLNSHRDDLPAHLRQAISLLKAREVPVDWAQLLSDIQDWDMPDRRVQRAWARAFWANRDVTEADAGRATDPNEGAAI